MHILLAAGGRSALMDLDVDKRTPLHWALANERQAHARELLATAGGPDQVLKPDKDGKNCLHIATERCGLEQMSLDLLELGGLELLQTQVLLTYADVC